MHHNKFRDTSALCAGGPPPSTVAKTFADSGRDIAPGPASEERTRPVTSNKKNNGSAADAEAKTLSGGPA